MLTEKKPKKRLATLKIVLFPVLGALMFCSKLIMEPLPNIHPLALLTVTYTVVFGAEALIPIYIYVVLVGIYAGFNLWWFPHLYIWLPLWGAAMLLPKKMSASTAVPVYAIVCCLHGLIYGTLYSPWQAIAFHLSFKATLAWIAAGFPWDVVHAVGNFFMGMLVFPLSTLIKKLLKTTPLT